MDVLAFQDKATSCAGAAVPVPLKDSIVGTAEALFPIDKLAFAVPLICGLKVTEKDALLPAARVIGRERPLTANSALLDVSDEIVTLAPLAVRVAVWLLEDPTATFPKLKTVGERLNRPEVVPVPERGTMRLESVAVDITRTEPAAVPTTVGWNPALKVTLSAGVRVMGVVIPLIENGPPEALVWRIVTFDRLVLRIVSVSVREAPTGTVPNETVDGVLIRAPEVNPVPVTNTRPRPIAVLLSNQKFPRTALLLRGANVMLTAMLW